MIVMHYAFSTVTHSRHIFNQAVFNGVLMKPTERQK